MKDDKKPAIFDAEFLKTILIYAVFACGAALIFWLLVGLLK